MGLNKTPNGIALLIAPWSQLLLNFFLNFLLMTILTIFTISAAILVVVSVQ